MRVPSGNRQWTTVKNFEDYRPWLRQRDSYPAGIIQREVLARNRRALIVYGDGHLQARSDRPGRSMIAIREANGARTFAVSSTFADLTSFQSNVASWPVPNLALVKATRLGVIPYEYLFGPQPPDPFLKTHPNVEDHFDAVLSLGPPAAANRAAVVPALRGAGLHRAPGGSHGRDRHAVHGEGAIGA